MLHAKQAPRWVVNASTLEIFYRKNAIVSQLPCENINFWDAFNIPNTFPDSEVAGSRGDSLDTSVALGSNVTT